MAVESFKVLGADVTVKELKQLGYGPVLAAQRQAVRSAASVLNKAVKRLVPKEHGVLKRSIGVKVKQNRKRNETKAWVGARQGYDKVIDGKKQEPWRYDHLVNNGFIARDGTRVAGARYMERADAEAGVDAVRQMQSKNDRSLAKRDKES